MEVQASLYMKRRKEKVYNVKFITLHIVIVIRFSLLGILFYGLFRYTETKKKRVIEEYRVSVAKHRWSAMFIEIG